MAADGYELFDSRQSTISAQNPATTFRYVVWGTDDPAEVTAWVAAHAPLVYGTLWIHDATLNPQGGGKWLPEVQYGPVSRDGMGKLDGTPLDPQGQPTPPAEPQRPQDEDELGPEYSFEVTGEPVHITQSHEVIDSLTPDPNTDPPDCKQAIGLTKDGIEGVDIEVGVLRVSETRKMRSITRKYLDTLAGMVGRVCDDKGFWGWTRREAKFDGASGQGHDNREWTVTFRLSVRKTRYNVDVSPDMRVPRVFGWDHIDVLYGNQVDEDTLIRTPVEVYVHRICEEADFKKLGIG